MKTRDIPSFGVLQGVRVLSSANFIAGPYMCGLFAEMGATVTSIERADFPDGLRTTVTEWFSSEHRNQLSMALDLRQPEGKEVLSRLLKENDIFVENAKGGSLAHMGITDEWIWSYNPKMVIVHVSGYGQSGDPSYTGRPCLDAIAQAFSGYMNLNGLPDMPMVARLYTADYMSSLHGAVGALAALRRVQQTGKGESVDVAMYESMLRVSADAVALGLNRGLEPKRVGNRTERAWGEGVYRCRDGKYIFWMSGQVGKTTYGTLKMVGMEQEDPGPGSPFSTKPEVGAELERRMKEYCDTHTSGEVMEAALPLGVLCCKVMNYDEMVEDPHFKARGTFIEWDDPCLGERMTGVRPTPCFANNPSKIWRGTPVLGMDNEDLLEEIGYTGEEIAMLKEKKVITYGSSIHKTMAKQ